MAAAGLLVGAIQGWEEVTVDTRLRAEVMEGCEGLEEAEEASRAGEAAMADEGNLPRQRKRRTGYFGYRQMSPRFLRDCPWH